MMEIGTTVMHAFGSIFVAAGFKMLLDGEDYATPAIAFGLFLLTYVVW